MAESLHDGHTSFMTPDEARRRNETSFAGVGVLMSRPQDSQPPLIAEIFPNSPAAGSGLKRGDRITAVDGQDVTGQAVGDIATLIRGAPGTQVRLQVRRLNSAQPLEYTMKRAVVQVDQVLGRQVPNAPIGYLKIRSFGDSTMVEQVLGIWGQQAARHRPGARDRGGEIRIRRLLAEQLMSVLRESDHVLFHALSGLSEVRGGVLDRDGQVAERRGQPPGLPDPLRVLCSGEPASLGQAGHGAPEEADGLSVGEGRDLDAVRAYEAWPVRLSCGNDDMPGRLTWRYVFLQIKRISGVIEYQ